MTIDADAIFYTHYHGDHVGLHHLIPECVAQYMGAGAIDVMRCKYEALNAHQDLSQQLVATERMIPFKERERIVVNNSIIVTPFFVSHSAFDAYMFLIECEGKRILHTGDFRREAKRVMDLDHPVPTVLAEVDFSKQQASGKYVCSICGYVYDPAEHDGVAFEELPDDWKCPRCRQGKDKFNKA